MKYQVWCASVVSVVSGCIRSFLQATPPKTPHTPGWHGRGTNWHCFHFLGPLPGFWHLSCRFRKARFQPHWHLIRKSSNEMQEEIVSSHWRIQKTRTPKTTEKYVFYWTFGIPRAVLAKQKSQTPITMTISDESHWSMPRKLYKEMKSRCRAIKLCKTLYLWRDDRYRSSTNQSWITRDRCTAVKSFN